MASVQTARERRAERNNGIKSAVLHIVYGGLGFLVAHGAVLGNLAPFGASYAAAVPKRNLAAAMAGTALGYAVRDPQDCFRYIAVTIAIGALRWLFS